MIHLQLRMKVKSRMNQRMQAISDVFDILARYAVGCLFIKKNQFDFKNLAEHYKKYWENFLDTMVRYIETFIEQGTVRLLEHLELSATLIIEILSW